MATKPLLPLAVLLMVGCIGTREKITVPAKPPPVRSAAEFARQFRAPPPSCRILKINHGWSGDAAARAAYVETVRRQGFGGAVTNVGFGSGYVTSPAQWTAFRAGIALLREAGLDLWLYDEAGYPSGRAGGLVLDGHPEREARALLATSCRVEVGADGRRNIGPQARVSASSTDDKGGIYAPRNAVDGNRDTRDWRHWSNDPAHTPTHDDPQWLLLEWAEEWSVQEVRLFTMEGYALQDYAIETWDGQRWQAFADAEVHGNTAVTRGHAATAAVKTDKLRLLGRRGPTGQPGIVRVVELEVLATPVGNRQDATCALTVPPGKLVCARAFRETADGGLSLSADHDLPAPVAGVITWTVPPGCWQLLAVSEDRLFDGSQVDFSGVPEHAPYVNLLDPATVSAFLQLTHDAYAKELGPDLGSWFVSTFTDEPSLLASYYARAMPWSPIAWHPRLATEFAARTGRELVPELPLLFADGPGAERTRYAFWQTVAEAFRENYFGRIRSWCRERHIPSGGHLLLEEDIRFHVSLYGDFFACLRELDVPGIDVLSCDPAHSPWFTARLASSAAELEGGSLVMSESSDFSEMWAKPPRPVSPAQFRGTLNRQLLGGVNRFNTYSPFRDLQDAELVQLNEWTGRCCLALSGGVRNARIGVVYPIETAWTRFKPSRQGTRDAGPLAERLARTIRQVDDLLYSSRREFSYLDSRTLREAGAKGGELRLRNLAWSVVVLPDTDTLPDAAWENLVRFWEAGGAVIAAGALPRNSEKEFPSPAVVKCGLRIFGAGAADAAESPSWAASRKGGIGVYLPPGRVGELPAILDLLLGPDVLVSPPAAPLRIARRAIDGRDVFLLINDSPDPWQGNVTFGQPARGGEILDPATGDIRPLAAGGSLELSPDTGPLGGPESPRRSAPPTFPEPKVNSTALSLAGWGAAIVRLEGVDHVARLHPEEVSLKRLLDN
jgi:hypothetical protein